MNKKHPFLLMGTIGLAVTAAINMFNVYVLGVGGDSWWSAWFPFYVVWFTFLIIGMGLSAKNGDKSKDGRVNKDT